MKNILLLVVAMAAMLSLGSCNVLKTNKPTTAPESPSTEVRTPAGKVTPALAGAWSIVDVGGKAVTVAGDDYPSMTFDTADCAPGQVNMYLYNGCNYINGLWAVSGNTLTRAGEFPSTMKYCAEAVDEIPINMALERVAGFAIEKINNEYFLYLKDAAGTTLMTLRKHNLNFFNGAWRVTEIGGVNMTGDRAPEMVIDLADGKIHGNAGCNVLNGSVTQNLDHEGGIGFTNLYTTRMTCPEIAIEQAFILALEEVETCVPGDNDNIALLKDATGKTVISMVRVSADQLAR